MTKEEISERIDGLAIWLKWNRMADSYYGVLAYYNKLLNLKYQR